MDITNLVTRIREELDDPATGTFFTDTDIFDSIEDAMVMLAIFTGYYNKSADITIVPNQVYYPMQLSDFLFPVAVYNPNTKLFLKPTNQFLLNKSINRWELTSGIPQLFCLFPTNLIAFYPYYSAVPQEPLKLYYKAYPSNFLNVVAGLQLPKIAEEVVLYYVVSDLYDQLLEMEKSVQAWDLFKTHYTTFKRVVEKVDRVDYVGVMNVY